MPFLEVCVDVVEHGILAADLGADRIELCSALEIGGVTPSLGLIASLCNQVSIPVNVLIRPRAGNFVYTEKDLQIMLNDITSCHEAGANGVVFGCLDTSHNLDTASTSRLLNHATSLGLKTTFHRAIDVSNNPVSLLNSLLEIGFDTVLTSGSKASAVDGVDLISQYLALSNGRLEILAGGGVNGQNANKLLKTGLSSLHFSCRTKKEGKKLNNQFGYEYAFDREKMLSMKALKI